MVRIPKDYPASAVYVSGGCGQDHKLALLSDGSALSFECEACEASLAFNGHGHASWWLDKSVTGNVVRALDE